MVLSQPYWLLCLLALPVLWWVLKRVGQFGHTRIDNVPQSRGGRLLMGLPRIVLALSFLALCLAMARPQRIYYESTNHVEGRDIVIAIDKSGSMSGELPGPMPSSIVGETDLGRDIQPVPKKPVDPSAQIPGTDPAADANRHTRI